MTISGLNQNATLFQTSQSAWQQRMQQRRQDFQSLASALQSGDLSGAQQAFQDLQQLQSSSSSSDPSQSGSSSNSTNPLSADFSALGQALQSGDLATAQSDFAQLQQDMQSLFQTHHHHHHQGATNAQNGTLNGTPSANGGVANGAPDADGDNDGSTGGNLNVSA